MRKLEEEKEPLGGRIREGLKKKKTERKTHQIAKNAKIREDEPIAGGPEGAGEAGGEAGEGGLVGGAGEEGEEGEEGRAGAGVASPLQCSPTQDSVILSVPRCLRRSSS
jgi:hypothetical protein